MPRTKKQSTEAAVREIRRRTRRKFSPALDPSPVIPSDLSFGYLSAELKSPIKIPIPTLRMLNPPGCTLRRRRLLNDREHATRKAAISTLPTRLWEKDRSI